MAHALTRADGRQLAIDMLRQIHELEPDAACIDRGTRVSAGLAGEQRNVVADYLRTMRERSSPELEDGFGEVLTDFLASALDGAVPDPEFYEAEDA
jgi:hypothetical protein